MSNMISCTLALFLLAATHSPAPKTPPAPMITYRNLTTGVSFRYPPVWKTVAKPESQTQPIPDRAGNSSANRCGVFP